MFRTTVLLALLLFFANAAISDTIADAAYLDGGTNEHGLILCHGRGKHPTWKVVDPLRKGVHDQLGFHTLSLQMPNQKQSFKSYAQDFPQAYDTIRQGIQFLQSKGVKKIYLMGHSMGSRMASAFLAENHDQPVQGLIIAGCRNNGGTRLNCKQNLKKINLPTLDIWGGAENKDNSAARERDKFISDTYQQVKIPDANHRFDGHEAEMVSAVVEWLKRQDAQ